MDDVVLLLANSAEANGGMVSALGIGWSVTSTPTPAMALAILIKVPWDQTNTKHHLTLTLVDADGKAPNLGNVDAFGNPAPLTIQAEFETGRPPGIPHGSTVDFAQALNIGPGLPLAPGQSYEWRMEIDGAFAARRPFRVRGQ